MNLADRFNLKGRVALVTGASKGIGEAIAHGLAQYGARVVICSRKIGGVEKVAGDIRQSGGEARAVECHVGEALQREQLLEDIIATEGDLHILVNNAAINPYYGPLEEIPETAYRKTFEVNLEAARLLSNLAVKYMKKHRMGSIIHMSSIEGFTPGEGMGVYSLTKAALNMLTMSQAREWGKFGIRVNAIAPGLIRTKFSAALIENPRLQTYFEQQVPLARPGNPEEIAGLALFLASDASSYCTGGIFVADGGLTICGGL